MGDEDDNREEGVSWYNWANECFYSWSRERQRWIRDDLYVAPPKEAEPSRHRSPFTGGAAAREVDL